MTAWRTPAARCGTLAGHFAVAKPGSPSVARADGAGFALESMSSAGRSNPAQAREGQAGQPESHDSRQGGSQARLFQGVIRDAPEEPRNLPGAASSAPLHAPQVSSATRGVRVR
jgi:hypothetical protein